MAVPGSCFAGLCEAGGGGDFGGSGDPEVDEGAGAGGGGGEPAFGWRISLRTIQKPDLKCPVYWVP